MNLNTDASLLVHLKLDETTGTTAYDSSANSNDGTLTGVDFATDGITGKYGRALSFVDAADQIDCGALGLGEQDQTLACWLRIDTAMAATAFLLSTRDASVGALSVTITTGPEIAFYVGITYKGGKALAGVIDDGNWHHIAVSYDASTLGIVLYVDGVAVHTPTLSAGTWDSTKNAMIHNRVGWSSVQDISLDDYRVYTRILTESEVIRLMFDPFYAYDLNTSPELECLYKMDGDATDSSPNGRDGTAVLTSYVSGKYGKALANTATVGHYFQGTNNAALDFTTEPMSVAFWLYVNSSADLSQYVFARASYNVSGYTISIKQDVGRIYFLTFIAGGNVASRVDIGAALVDTWNHFCFIRHGTTVKLYLNGVAQAWDVAGSHPDFISYTGDLLIAALNTVGSQNLNGSIDDVRVYSRILSADEAYTLATNPYGITNKQKKLKLLGV